MLHVFKYIIDFFLLYQNNFFMVTDTAESDFRRLVLGQFLHFGFK